MRRTTMTSRHRTEHTITTISSHCLKAVISVPCYARPTIRIRKRTTKRSARSITLAEDLLTVNTSSTRQRATLVQVHVNRRSEIGINSATQLRIIRIDRVKLDIGQTSIIDDRCGPRMLILAPRSTTVDQMNAIMMPAVQSAEIIAKRRAGKIDLPVRSISWTDRA